MKQNTIIAIALSAGALLVLVIVAVLYYKLNMKDNEKVSTTQYKPFGTIETNTNSKDYTLGGTTEKNSTDLVGTVATNTEPVQEA